MGKLTSNYTFVLIYQFILILTPIFTTPYISRVLGSGNLGIDAYVFSIVQVFQVFLTLGIGLHGKKQMASTVGKKAIQIQFSNIYSVQLVTSILVLSLYIVYVSQVQEYRSIFWGYTPMIVAAGLDVAWYFIGLEKIKQVMIRNIFVRIFSIILIFLFVNNDTDLWKFVLINSLSLFMGQIINWIILIKEVKKFNFSIAGLKSNLRPILILAIIPCVSLIYISINKIVLGIVVGEIEVGFYNQAYKIIVMCMVFLSALSTVMMPRMVHLYSIGEEEKFKEMIEVSINYTFLTTLPLIGIIIVLADSFVPFYLGNEFSSVINLLKILTPAILLQGLSYIFGLQILIVIGSNNTYAISIVLGAIVSIITNFLIVTRFNSIGTAISYDVSILITLLVQVYYSRVFVSLKRILYSFLKYSLFTISMVLVLISTKNSQSQNFIFLFIEILIAMITYIILLFISRDVFLFKIIDKIFKKRIEY
ncbi:oligosaccharide flippase family protein [Bacillus thuringiensis]|nr:oligosaccharide flippase family protein [Bacillus thuringiensis]